MRALVGVHVRWCVCECVFVCVCVMDSPPSPAEFKKALGSLKSRKAGRASQVLPKMIIHAGPDLHIRLLNIMVLVWKREGVVHNWQNALFDATASEVCNFMQYMPAWGKEGIKLTAVIIQSSMNCIEDTLWSKRHRVAILSTRKVYVYILRVCSDCMRSGIGDHLSQGTNFYCIEEWLLTTDFTVT